MDYEKKYKEALERASKLRVQNPFDTVSQMMEHVFPELKESEDERIRKTLIEYIKGIKSWNYFLGISKEQMIAWLEKQVSIDENEVAKCVLNELANSIMRWLDANLAEGNMCLSNMECEDIENAVRNANWQKIYGYMKKKLEKQDNFFAKWEKNIANNKPALNHSVLMKNIYGIAEGEWNGKEWIQYRWSSKIKDSDVLYWMNLYELEKQGKHTQGNTALEAIKEEKVDNQKMINKIIKEVADLVKERTDFSAKEVADLVSENIIFIKKEVLTSDEAARYLGMSKSYLYKLTMKKEIPHFKPLGKMCYFNRQELEAWLQSNRVAMDVKHLTK